MITAETQRGLQLYKNQRFKEASEVIYQSAKAGDDFAYFYIHSLYISTDSSDLEIFDDCLKHIANNPTVLSWIQQQAADNNAKAQHVLGHLLLRDNDTVPQDYPRAFDLLSKAAAKGSSMAQESLANLYLEGLVTSPDKIQAEYWYRRAAQSGNALILDNLGGLYRRGAFGKCEFSKAWFYWCATWKASCSDVHKSCILHFADRDKASALADEALIWQGLRLDFSACNLNQQVFTLAAEELEKAVTYPTNPNLKALNLASNALTEECLPVLVRYLRAFPALTKLDLSKNVFSPNTITIVQLTNLINEHPNLTTLDLSKSPNLNEFHLATIESLLQPNRELEQQFQQAIDLEKQASQNTYSNPDTAESTLIQAIEIMEALAEKNYFSAKQQLNKFKLSLAQLYSENNQLALCIETLKGILDTADTAATLAEALFRAELLPFTDPFDKYRFIILLLRDEKRSLLTEPTNDRILRQAVYTLQKRSIIVNHSASLFELIDADKIIPYKDLQALTETVNHYRLKAVAS